MEIYNVSLSEYSRSLKLFSVDVLVPMVMVLGSGTFERWLDHPGRGLIYGINVISKKDDSLWKNPVKAQWEEAAYNLGNGNT